MFELQRIIANTEKGKMTLALVFQSFTNKNVVTITFVLIIVDRVLQVPYPSSLTVTGLCLEKKNTTRIVLANVGQVHTLFIKVLLFARALLATENIHVLNHSPYTAN